MTESDWFYAIRDGAILALLASAFVLVLLRANPRLFLRHFPAEVRAATAPKTQRERRISVLIAIPLFVLLLGIPYWSAVSLTERHGGSTSFGAAFTTAFVAMMIFNAVDWLVLDELYLGLNRPRWAAIPGTEHIEFRFDHAQHFRGFVIGTALSAVIGLAVAATVA
jgi:hypothetical protein